MKHKLTPFDLALWAALPMAHTSKVEGRIKMVLDSTRRRTSPRRFLLLAVVTGAAALVPLAILRPAAKAQTAPAGARAVQLIGIADVSAPSGQAWDQAGNVLQAAFPPPLWERQTKVSAPPSQKVLSVAFRFAAPLQPGSRIVVNGSDAPLGRIVLTQLLKVKGISKAYTSTANSRSLEMFGEPVIYAGRFPALLKHADFWIGVASAQGVETVNCPKTVGKVQLHRTAGDVIFTLLPHPHGNAVLMVFDHFHSPSPLKVDEMAVVISSYASTHRSGDAVQKILHDGENYERTVYGMDKSGRIVAELAGTYAPTVEEEADDRFKMEQLFSIPRPLLKRITSFRLVARPYQWTAFKNVALQPSK